MNTSPENIAKLAPNEVFVFGSNHAGRHGKGAALSARKWGAQEGKGEGLMGQTYGIPTKDERLRVLPLWQIGYAIGRFLKFAAAHPELTFLVTPVGCGLAGYSPKQVGPLFKTSLPNVALPACFVKELRDNQVA